MFVRMFELIFQRKASCHHRLLSQFNITNLSLLLPKLQSLLPPSSLPSISSSTLPDEATLASLLWPPVAA